MRSTTPTPDAIDNHISSKHPEHAGHGWILDGRLGLLCSRCDEQRLSMPGFTVTARPHVSLDVRA